MMCCILEVLTIILWSLGVIFGLIIFLVAAAYTLNIVSRIIFPKQHKITSGYKEEWFGKGAQPDDDNGHDTSVRPFKINVPDEVLKDLKERLERTRYEDPVENSRFEYGFNPNFLRKLVNYWKSEYDWRKQERMLNQFPQYKTRIEGLDIHFIHVKPDLPADSQVKVLPLMLIHGWPGPVTDFYKLIPLLTTPRPACDFVFEVICPAIPGFGFSESPHRSGLDARAVARIFITLMERIGHRKFYLQGGDWGATTAHIMARYYSPRVLGLHINMYFCNLRAWEFFKFIMIAFFPFLVSKAEYKTCFPIKRLLKMYLVEGGYFHIQSTNTDTLGCAMSDSPAGMAAYLLEKFCYATNLEYVKLEDGGLMEKFTMDECLTTVMVYWVNNNFAGATRYYRENIFSILKREHEQVPILVPTGIAVFPKEVLMFPKACTSQQIKNLVSYNIMPRGGHFAVLEEPGLLADDVWQFVKLVEK